MLKLRAFEEALYIARACVTTQQAVCAGDTVNDWRALLASLPPYQYAVHVHSKSEVKLLALKWAVLAANAGWQAA